MYTLFKRLLGTSPRTKQTRQDNGPATDAPVTIEDGSDNAMRRQLIQVLLRDVIRRHGMPPHWIELRMLMVSSASRGSGLYVRLVLKHWDVRLLNHAQAFQNELLTDIRRFEPKASEWLHGISWEFEMGDSCPYTTLPDRAFWQAPRPAEATGAPVVPTAPMVHAASVRPSPAAGAQNDAMEDLNQLFFIRDREISRAADEAGLREYEKTQPLPL